MAILDSLKDPATGQIKKPILYSLIGGAGLFAYLLLHKGGVSGAVSTGQTTPLTPDLTGLQDALKTLAGNGTTGPTNGTNGSNGSNGSNGTNGTSGGTGNTGGYTGGGNVAGSSGAGGGGGGGTGSVIHPIAKAPSVYAGLTGTVQPIPGVNIIGSKKALPGLGSVAASATIVKNAITKTPAPTVIGSKKVLPGTGAVAASATVKVPVVNAATGFVTNAAKTVAPPKVSTPVVKAGQAPVAS